MSAFAMKPTFKDEAGYRRWRDNWRRLFHRVSADIRAAKRRAKDAQRNGDGKAQRDLRHHRAMGTKLMGLLADGKARRERIAGIRRQIQEQSSQFPVTFLLCDTVDFHFNKACLEWPDLPSWTIKTKGRSFYVQHVEAHVGWSTREVPDGSTKGMIRFRRCALTIDEAGVAHLYAPK